MLSIRAVLTAYKLGGPPAARDMGVYLPEYEQLMSDATKAVGAGSACWDHEALLLAGTFQSERAIKVAEKLVDAMLKEFIAAQLRARKT